MVAASDRRSSSPASPPSPVGEVIARSFAGTAVGARLSESRIWLVWESAVGDRIARVAHPRRFSNGTLTVGVTNSPWLQQLRFLKQEIMDAVNDRLGTQLVTDLYFTTGQKERPSTRETVDRQREPASHPLSPDDQRFIDTLVSAIDDPDLSAAFRRLLEAYRRRRDR